MKRFTQSILAIATIFATTAASAQDSGITNKMTLKGTSAGDLESIFTYNRDNRLTSVESFASKVTYDYSPATLSGRAYDMTMRISDPSGDIMCYIEIGDNGFISKSVEIEEVMDEQAPYKTYTFSYDSEGHLTEINEIGDVDFSTTTFEYIDGNIVAASTTGSCTENIAVSYSSPSGMKEIANTAGVMDYSTFGLDGIETRYFNYAGLLGNATASLPTKTELTSNGTTTSESYLWTIDGNGNPTSRNIFTDDTFSGSTGYLWASTSSAADISRDTATPEAYYSVNGIRLTSPVRGINIASTHDGCVTKTIRR